MYWLINNIGTIYVSLVLVATIVLIIFKLIHDKKIGKSSCGWNCAHCAMAGQCRELSPTCLRRRGASGRQ